MALGTIDSEVFPFDNSGMQITENPKLDADIMRDIQAVAEAAATGKPLDPAVARRIRERSALVQEELRKRYGVREIAVELIRQGRDEE